MHVIEERRQILRDLLVSNQVLCIVSRIQLGDEVSACLVDVLDCLRESVVILLRIFETDWA